MTVPLWECKPLVGKTIVVRCQYWHDVFRYAQSRFEVSAPVVTRIPDVYVRPTVELEWRGNDAGPVQGRKLWIREKRGSVWDEWKESGT